MNKLFSTVLGMARRAPQAASATSNPSTQTTTATADPAGELTDAEISELIAKLAGPVRLPGGIERRPRMPLSEETIDAIAREWTDPADLPPTEVEREQLRAAQQRIDALEGAINAHSRDRAADFHAESTRNYAQAAANGENLEFHEARSRADIDRLFEARRGAAKQEIRKICADAWPVARGILQRYIAFARKRAEALAVSEFREYRKLGVTYTPSALSCTLLDLAENVEVRIAKTDGTGSCPWPRNATLGIVTL